MCQFRNVLIPTDFGPAAWNAMKFAIKMCGDDKAVITLLHIYPSNAKFDSRTKKLNDEEQEEMNRLKEKMKLFSKDLIKGNDVKIETVILKGWVDAEIPDFISKNEFDLIIMGVNSNGFDNRPGSHIFKMIEQANIPLMVIPNTIQNAVVNA